MLTAAVLTGLGFTACGNDDDSEDVTTENGDFGPTGSVSAVDPSKVFTSGVPEQAGSYQTEVDQTGRVASVSSSYETMSFSYGAASYKGQTYDMMMTTTQNVRYSDDNDVFYANLNPQGFIKYVLQVKDDGVDKWWFSYNAAGQLIRMKRTEGDNEVTTIKYTDGDITSVSMTSDDSDNAYTCTISYGDEPILNKGGLMLFDKTFSIDMDEMYPAYLAGLLGYATKHLPVKNVSREEGSTYTETFEWTLNDKGLPTSMTANDGYSSQMTTFTW